METAHLILVIITILYIIAGCVLLSYKTYPGCSLLIVAILAFILALIETPISTIAGLIIVGGVPIFLFTVAFSSPCQFHGCLYADWQYKTSNTCIQCQYCKRCGKKNPQTQHQHEHWTEWQYVQEGACSQERHCTRCHFCIQNTKHLFTQQLDPQKCEWACERCKQTTWKHQWNILSRKTHYNRYGIAYEKEHHEQCSFCKETRIEHQIIEYATGDSSSTDL